MDAHPRATRRIRGRTRTAGVEAHPRTDAHPRATRRIRGRTRTRGRRGASADGRAPAGDEAHPRTDAHCGRRGASADGRAPASDEAHPRTDAHPRATRRIRGRTRTRGRRGASADGRAPAGDEAHPRTDAHPRASRRIRGRTRTRERRGAFADGRASAGDEAHPRTDAHPRATRRIRGRTRTRERRGASADGRAPAGHEAQSRATQTQLRVTRRHHTLRDRTTLPSGVVLFDRTRPQAGVPLPDPPRAPVHDDNPDRWGANLNTYNRLRDTYTLQREAHRVAEAAHADATTRLLSYAQDEKDYAEELRKIHKDVAAWRIADRRALAIIFSCIPSHLKRDLRPTSSSGLWKTLSTQYDRQDLRSLLALFRKFQDITLDSSPTAAAYTRRLIDTAQRLNDRGIVISESLLTARILDCLPPTYDTYRITFTSRYRHPPPVADTIEWLLDSEADIQRDSATVNAVQTRKATTGNHNSGTGGGPRDILDPVHPPSPSASPPPSSPPAAPPPSSPPAAPPPPPSPPSLCAEHPPPPPSPRPPPLTPPPSSRPLLPTPPLILRHYPHTRSTVPILGTPRFSQQSRSRLSAPHGNPAKPSCNAAVSSPRPSAQQSTSASVSPHQPDPPAQLSCNFTASSSSSSHSGPH
ncbi:unnamed protein product [Closterium sp. NIES-64]|nr:unnamed protein product [Closterium sp. NIES-64]